MKIYLMTDLEGVCGVINVDDWTQPTSRYYEEGRRLLTQEANAAVEGLVASGATEIWVIDGHGAGAIHQTELDPRTLLVRGFPGPYPFGLDASFDAIAWVGQHAKAGTEYAHIAHTGWFNVLDYRINGVSVGEFGQMAMCGAFLGVRSIFASGDEAFCKEAHATIPTIVTVSVKHGLTPGSGDEYDCDGYRNRNLAAVHLHPEKARDMIREGASAALSRFAKDRDSFPLLEVNAPFRREVLYRPNGVTPAYRSHAEHPTDLIRMLNTAEIRD